MDSLIVSNQLQCRTRSGEVFGRGFQDKLTLCREMVRGLCTMVAKTKQLPGITTLASNTEAIIGVGGVRARARVWVWVGGWGDYDAYLQWPQTISQKVCYGTKIVSAMNG